MNAFSKKNEMPFLKPVSINCTVHYGTVLGHFFYLIFTADIPAAENIVTATLADDTAILIFKLNLVTASRKLQNPLDQLQTWFSRSGKI